MAYAVYSEHPESQSRKAAEDFSTWSVWAEHNAPWTGVSTPDMASLLEGVCEKTGGSTACDVLDVGGILQPPDARLVLNWAEGRMGEKTKHVFQHAVQHGYPVRVVFSKGFGAPSASAYLANASST